MPRLDDENGSAFVVHCVPYPAPTLPDAVPPLPGELLASVRARAVGERLDATNHHLAVLLRRYPFDLLDGRRFDEDLISFHRA